MSTIKSLKIRFEESEWVFYCCLNNSFQYLNNTICIFTHFYTHIYFHKITIMLLAIFYQTGPKSFVFTDCGSHNTIWGSHIFVFNWLSVICLQPFIIKKKKKKKLSVYYWQFVCLAFFFSQRLFIIDASHVHLTLLQ